jgi:hypothetical protein
LVTLAQNQLNQPMLYALLIAAIAISMKFISVNKFTEATVSKGFN